MIFYFKTTTGPKPRRVAHTHSAHSACRGPTVEPSWPGLAWPTWHWPARERGPDRSAEAAHEVASSHMARARAGRGTTAGGQRLIDGQEGLTGGDHCTSATLHGKVSRTSSSQTSMAMRGRCSPVVTLCPHRNRGAR
jgi:hypothetical protein